MPTLDLDYIPAELEEYIGFVKERHSIWKRRVLHHQRPPWTRKPLLQHHPYTNVYRALDMGSQFLLGMISDPDIPLEDVLLRCFLYRYTNRPEPWRAFRAETGRWPSVQDVQADTLATIWSAYSAGGGVMFGSAYKMFVGGENAGTSRLGWVLRLAAMYLDPESPLSVVDDVLAAPTLHRGVQQLRAVPRCAGFMSMQVATDLSYSGRLPWDENSYVVPGPGAKRGIKALAPNADPLSVIWLMRTYLRDDPALAAHLALQLPGGVQRAPSVMDVQNTFCEFGKYVRYRDQDVRKRRFISKHDILPEPAYPPGWARYPDAPVADATVDTL